MIYIHEMYFNQNFDLWILTGWELVWYIDKHTLSFSTKDLSKKNYMQKCDV